MARIYATRADLVNFVPATITVPQDPETTRSLTRASERVDLALRTAVYATDMNGLPTDANFVAAFRDATCAQAQWWLENGDETGQAAQWSSMGIGSVNLVSARNGQGGTTTSALELCPQAGTTLLLAVSTTGVPLLTSGAILHL